MSPTVFRACLFIPTLNPGNDIHVTAVPLLLLCSAMERTELLNHFYSVLCRELNHEDRGDIVYIILDKLYVDTRVTRTRRDWQK